MWSVGFCTKCEYEMRIEKLTFICQGVIEFGIIRVSICLGDLNRSDYGDDDNDNKSYHNNSPGSFPPRPWIPPR